MSNPIRVVLLTHRLNDVRARLALWLCLAAFFGLLQVSYVVFVSRHFAYMGFTLEFEVLQYVEATLVFLAFASFLSDDSRRPSSVFLVLYCVLLLAPLSVLFAFKGLAREPLYLVFFAGLGMFMVTRLKVSAPGSVRNADKVLLCLSAAALIAAVAWIGVSGSISHFNLNPVEVYGQRAAVGDLLYRGGFSYLLPMTFKGFAVGLLVYALWRRQRVLTGTLIILFVFFYGATGHKSVLAIPFLVIGVYVWYLRGAKLWHIPAAITGVITVALVVSIVSDDVYAASILIRRAFFVPAHLVAVYIEYYEGAGFRFFSTVLFARLLGDKGELPPQTEISVFLTGSPDIWYNAGFVATGYMHAGVLGVLIYAVLAGVILSVVDSLARGGYTWPAVAMTIVPISILFTTADLVTTFLSHGLLVSLALMWLFRVGIGPAMCLRGIPFLQR